VGVGVGVCLCVCVDNYTGWTMHRLTPMGSC